MAILDLDYYTQKDHYSDGDIEERMLEMAKEGISYEDLPKEQVEFPILYHFSDVRKNILCWYPFQKTDSVLEIGSGCGAITGMLCEKAGKVTSVELSKRRASINYERNKDKQNLTIMVGNQNDMVFPDAFDYVVVNGVLEYAMSFTEGDTPYETFLEKMGAYLKSSGKLLIAIENKLGLKYFAGSPEDHTDLYFLGINGYPGNRSVRTFSKTELSELLTRSGYPYRKYYYPYPDYKFPTEIFTDESLYRNHYGKGYPVYTQNNMQLFSEEVAVAHLKDEQIMDRFVNSFLVVAGKEEIKETEKILYVKLNQERKPQFRLMTLLVNKNGVLRAEKQAMHPEAVSTLHRMVETGRSRWQGTYRYLPCTYQNGAISYPLLQGITLDQKIRRWVEEKRLDLVEDALHEVYDCLFAERRQVSNYQNAEFREVFGEDLGKDYYECIQPANIDLICANIIEDAGEYKIIDYEWVFSFPVPVSFIMWRLLHELYSSVPTLSGLCFETDMMEKFGISYSDYEIFMKWTMHFVYTYVGSDKLSAYQKPRIQIPLKEIVQKELHKNCIDTKLYYDLGEGLNEQNVIAKTIHLEKNRFTVSFDLRKINEIKGLRWSIAAGQFCEFKVDHIACNCRIRLLTWDLRKEIDDNTNIFLTDHISFFVDAWNNSEIKEIKIQGRIRFLDHAESEKTIEEKLEQERQAMVPVCEPEAVVQPAEQQNVEAAPVTLGKKARVKRIIKKMLGMPVEAVQPPVLEEPQEQSTCTGSIDYFSFTDTILSVVGWAFDMVYPMNKTRLVFYHGEEKVEETSYTVIYRKDVVEIYGNSDMETSGFSFVGVVQTPVALEAYLEYDTEVGAKKFPLGTLEGDPSQGEIQVFTLEDPDNIGNIRYFIDHHTVQGCIPDLQPKSQTIDIIIPIYNGLQYFDSLFSGIERTRMDYRLILIDDKSPDVRVTEYLDHYAETHANVVLLRNEENLGFVRSVNRGLSMAENHVALVNTDVEVPEQWLERLMEPILTRENVATTTPFTTCGTVCSFPEFCKDNAIFEGLPLWIIDDAFRRIMPQYPVLPTGVGFCMGMNIEAIRKVGLLDAETFGKGYGEENDWCQRAIEAGFVNLQVDNLYVYHKHGGSFPSEEKQKLLEHNLVELSKKHPNYNRDTAAFCRRDPSKSVRLYTIMQLLNQQLDAPTIVAFDHNLGGGATDYLEEKKKIALRDGKRFLTIRYDVHGPRYWLIYEYKKYRIKFTAKELDLVFEQIQRVDEIWINELVTYADLYKVQEKILELKNMHQAYLKMLLHDFYCVCPAVNLMDAEGNYCGVPSVETCNICVPKNRSNACLDYESGTAWRKHWEKFLKECDEILAFSDDTAKIFRRVYPMVYRLHVLPHKPHFVLPLNKTARTSQSFTIGLLGVLAHKKGLDVVKSMISYIEQNHLDIRIKLIGVSDEEINSSAFSCTGRYTKAQLPWLTLTEDIDMFLIPSIWPETFSYTTSEIISMQMPLAVLPIGAPVERVVHYDKGLVLSNDKPESILKEMQEFAKEKLQMDAMPLHMKRILFVGEEISFASRYRVEHFREQLYYHGYGSDFIQMQEREQINLSSYGALVFYRCSILEGVQELAEKARCYHIPVYYDIDDFIFNYDRISYLRFLSGSEYLDFRQTTEKIHTCMELCDGFFTSTNTLAEEIRKEFPGKPVVINRNCASMEMQILSHDALEEVEKSEDKVYIGYFSGSKTHDQDFEIVEEALEAVMKKYPQVYLKLVGVLSEDKMKRLQNRIEKLPFMEWQKLPGVTAGIDINLMPLEDSLFHWCKSENKWMEAALVKVPSVMSRNPEMAGVVENGETAFLCSTKEEWMQALESLVLHPELRKSMGEKANQVVLERYITQNMGKDAREELLCRGNFSK